MRYPLSVTRYLSLVTCHALPVTRYGFRSLVTCHALLVTRYASHHNNILHIKHLNYRFEVFLNVGQIILENVVGPFIVNIPVNVNEPVAKPHHVL
jgi:hypothetical protein